MNKKLVLFDIDGTLIYQVAPVGKVGFPRFIYAVKKTFGIDVTIDTGKNYNGWVDLQITVDIVKPYGITRETVMQKSSLFAEALHEFALTQGNGHDKLYYAIPEAVALAEHVLKNNSSIGLLTGNVERMARWKLSHAGVPDIFPFGLFADDVDDRIVLAKTVFEKSKKYFGIRFAPKDIIVIGDAIPDIRCAKAIGATTIIAMTGHHSSKEELSAERPDILVDTLMDTSILHFFKILQK